MNSNLRSKQGELEPLWTSVKRSSLRPVLNDTKISVGCCAVNSSPGKYTFKQQRKPSKTARSRVQRVCCLMCWACVHSPSKMWFCCIDIAIIPPNHAIYCPRMLTTAFSILYTSSCKHRKPPPFPLATYKHGLRSCPHSLYNWVHCSESFCQYLQFTIGYVIQRWPRVARQHHLQEDKI